jgi:hypothetical protein
VRSFSLQNFFTISSKKGPIFWSQLATAVDRGLAEKDDFRAITAKNAD